MGIPSCISYEQPASSFHWMIVQLTMARRIESILNSGPIPLEHIFPVFAGGVRSTVTESIRDNVRNS